jgi:diguanylate cyclase (GGDEF)-like protein/PAS domain S-box-containing protein
MHVPGGIGPSTGVDDGAWYLCDTDGGFAAPDRGDEGDAATTDRPRWLDIDGIHPDDRERFEAMCGALRSRPGAARVGVFRVEDDEGGWQVFELHAVNLIGVDGIGAIAVHGLDVTGRHEREAELARSESWFRSIIDNSTDGLVALDADGRIEWASSTMKDLLGFEPADAVGRHVLDFVHPDDVEKAIPSVAQLVAGRVTGEPVIVRARHRDGRWRWVEGLTKEPAEGQLTGSVFSLRDVTARVEAERARVETEARFRTVVANSYDVVAVIDPDAVISWVTPNCERLLGWTPDEIEGTSGFDLVHPDEHGLVLAELAGFLAGDRDPEALILRMRHKRGTWHHMEVISTDFLDHPGIEGIALNLRLVDERIDAEKDRQRLLDIFELTHDLVVTHDVDGQLVYVNAAARRFFGLDVDDDLSRLDLRARLGADSLERLMLDAVPALLERGSWTGELEILGHDDTPVPTLAQLLTHVDPDGRLEYTSATIRDISERKAFEVRLRHEATHDALTGLPNRTLLLDRLAVGLARSERRGSRIGVLFCDLDHFKVVNDSLGHSQGDRLLVEVAARLSGQLRLGDTVGRFGGDEFVILCEDIDGADDATRLAERVSLAFHQPFDLDDADIVVGMSIGIAVSQPGVADAETLIRDADAAMYRAKAQGRARYQLFEPHIRHQAVDRFELERELRAALGNDELEVFYQPVFDLAGGHVVGAEALLRWNHPTRGVVAPDDFIALAEETGLIVPLGTWVLEAACRHAQEWGATAAGHEHLWVAVNISGRQLEDGAFVDRLREAIDRSGIDPGRLHLEVTESVLMRDAAYSARILERLKALGITIAVDDFGTGYSSLSYLRRFPVDSLKIDRSFVDGLGLGCDDSTIVAAVVNLAHTLGLKAIAEGVEHPRQRAELERLGCDQAQGYLLGRPVPAAALTRSVGLPPVRAEMARRSSPTDHDNRAR